MAKSLLPQKKKAPKNVAAAPVENPQWDVPLTGGATYSAEAPSKHQAAMDFLTLSQFAPASTRKETLGLSGKAKKGTQELADRQAVGIPATGGLPKFSKLSKEQVAANTAAAKAAPPSAAVSNIGRQLQDATGLMKASVPEAQGRRTAQHTLIAPERYAGGVGGEGMTPKEHYEAKGWQERPEERVEDNVGRRGMEHDPRLLDIPKRWEEMTPEHQASVLKAAAHYGVTPDSARRAFGTQLDRAMAREEGRHGSFYEVGGASESGDLMPRSVLERTAERHGVGMDVAAAATAITSPKNRFIMKLKGKGKGAETETRYPNAESAEIGIKAGQQIGEEATKGGKPLKEGETGQTFLKNRKQFPSALSPHKTIGMAAEMAAQVLHAGKQVPEVWFPGGFAGSGSGDKVRAFYNAQLAPKHPKGQFLVSDIHTGGHGFAPHLSQGEKEAYLGIAGIHAFHDKIARDLMAERGLTNVSRTQSAQWSQNKMETGTEQDVKGMTPAAVNQGMAEHTPEQPVQGRSKASRRGGKAA